MSAMDRPISRPPTWRQRRVLIGLAGAVGALALLVVAMLAAGATSSVRVPAALKPYMGGLEVIKPAGKS